METPNTYPLTQRQKAAAVVQLMIETGDGIELAKLPESTQSALTDALGDIRRISRQDLDAIVAEFTAEIESIGLTAPGSRDGAIEALSAHLSPPLAESLRQQLTSVREGDHWPLVVDLPEAEIVKIMQNESIEVSAIVLSKTQVSKAAAVLSKLEGPHARAITYAMSKTADVKPDAVRRIGAALAQDYARPSPRAFDKPPVQRLGAVLNATPSETREDVLEHLDAQDRPFASDVRKAIFTFKDIAPRVQATDIPNVIRNVDNTALSTALAAASASDDAHVKSAEFILSSLSQRMASQLRDEIDERGKVQKDKAEAAMAEVTAAIREMVEAGLITLKDPDDELAPD
ncbi:FliG C-terminal domain-containing protein [Yoonia litorea]|uniref:Flagellar motor switch protein FliG n=1 Tax=Yoonia litorea TaxID=1123755 RepID=A0A1I6LVR7_9RHOB|nr:FliG C-terminal domain-containing protein [Yoonia litorea]SFS07535.1 flagellar motor switch protein FliG [Yoonia litorea]